MEVLRFIWVLKSKRSPFGPDFLQVKVIPSVFGNKSGLMSLM